MPPSNLARTLGLCFGFVIAFVASCVLLAQTPGSGDSSSPDSMRERRLVQRLQQARQLLAPDDSAKKPDYAQGVRLLQSLLDDGRGGDEDAGAEDLFLEPGEVVAADLLKGKSPARSVKSEARRILGNLSAEGRQAYELLIANTARLQFEAARTRSDWRTVEDVARRYFHSAAGYEATHALALRELDSGEPLAAARRLEELHESPRARNPREPQLSLQLTLALRLAGQTERCREVLIELKQSFGDRPVTRRDGRETMPLFVRDEDALSWLDRWAGAPLKPTSATREVRTEWAMAFGGASRNALAAPAVPTKHVDWSHSLLDNDEAMDDDEESPPAPEANATEEDRAEKKNSPQAGSPLKALGSPTVLRGGWGRVRQEVRGTLDQWRQAEQPIVPAAQPIVVGDVVLVRTLSQLRAFRLSTGEPLWHSALVDAELSEFLAETPRGRSARSMRPELGHWLNHRLWDDLGSGSLSSDGELVFSLQERGGGLMLPPQMARRGMFLPQEFNKLIAVEVRTGRLRWEAGGPRGDHELSGAGAFILGPPLPWRGRLWVLTDDGAEIRLNVLDPRDGRLLWTLALTDGNPFWSSVPDDAGFSPSIAGDCVICPTGAGSIVAVDPVRRELRWQFAYGAIPVERTPQRRFEFHVPAVEKWWRQSVVLVAGDRLLVAAPDHDELLCLNSADGQVQWQRPRGDGLFLAGVTDESVLVVGQNEVRSLRLSDGSLAWPQAAKIAPPCGRGALIDGVLHLPLITGEVISVEARSGRLLARTEVGVPSLLGNLIAADGRLVSQSAQHIAAFPALRELQQDLARTLEENADNALALERRGQMHLHLGRRERGMEDLRRAVALRPKSDAKSLLVALLLEELRLEHGDRESTIRELEPLVDDQRQRLTFARLRAHSLQQQGKSLAAAREYLKLADAWEKSNELEDVGSNMSARLDRWIGARLAELRDSLAPTERSSLDDELQQRLRTALEEPGVSSLRQFVSLYGWNDIAATARRALIERLDPKKHRHELEAALLTLRRAEDKQHQAFATARLAQQWILLGQVAPSRPLLVELETRFADVPCLGKQTGRELAERWQTEFRNQLDTKWPTEPLRVEKTQVQQAINRTFHLDWDESLDPFHDNWQLEMDASTRSLVARDSLGRVQWQSKLPFDEQSGPHVVGNSAIWHGRWLVLILGDRFQVLDTISPEGTTDLSPRLLWQHVLFDPRLEQVVTPVPAQQSTPIQGSPTSFAMTSSGRRLGRAVIIGDDVLCYQMGTRLVAAELDSGETLWTFDGLPTGCEISGDDRAIVVTPVDGREVIVFSTLDGRLLARREIGSAKWLTSVGRNLLTWSSSERTCELHLTDAHSGANLLKEQFTNGSLPCLSLRDSVAVLEPSGRLRLWNLVDGRKLLEHALPPLEHLTHFVILRDRERWLLLTNVDEPIAPGTAKPRVRLMNFDHWRVHGPCFAIDRSTGKQLWSATLDWQGVNAAQPADVPILVLAAKVMLPAAAEPRIVDTEKFKVVDTAKFKVVVLDKRNGQLLPLGEELQSNPLNHHSEQRPNFEGKTIDVQVERSVYRLSFIK